MWIKHGNTILLNLDQAITINKVYNHNFTEIIVQFNYDGEGDMITKHIYFKTRDEVDEAMRTIESGIKAGEKIVYL